MAVIKKCIGCGIELQSEYPNQEGYLPADKMEDGGDLYCQRCFKIKNYGKYTPVIIDKEEYRKEVNSVLDQCKVAIAVFDIIDFEGSFDTEILDILREKDSIVVINKLDLVPDKKHPSEVADWVKYRLDEEGIAPLDIAIISTKNGYGINGIYKKLKHFYPDGVCAIVLGVTNVGKSSVVNRLLGTKIITESKYPGTTIKSLKRRIPHTDIDLIDTPGLIPSGRISDMVCSECSLKMIPSSEISRTTYKMKNDRMLLIERLLWLRILNESDLKPIFSVYVSKNITLHETRKDKGTETFDKYDDREILKIPCEKCIEKYRKLRFIKKNVKINPGEEMVIKGLGWISVKRGPLELEIYLPEDVELITRRAFIKHDKL